MTSLHKGLLILLLNVVVVASSFGTITYRPASPTVGCADTFLTSKLGTFYQWSFGANAYPHTFSSALPVAASAFLTPGSHTVYVTVTTGGGTVADSVTVNVDAGAENVSLTSNMPVCQEVNDPVTFTASPSTYEGYAFFVNDSLYQLGASTSFVFPVVTGDSFRVFGFDGTCFTNASNTLYDHTPAPPSVTSTLPVGDTICAGDSVTFTANPTAAGDSFLFYVGGSLQQHSTSNTWEISSLSDSTFITAFVYNQYGCRNYFYSNSILVRVKPTPEMTITASDSAICPGNSVTFTGSALQGNSSNYIFSINSLIEQNGAGSTYTTSSLINGDSITVTGTLNGCVGKASAPVIETVFTGSDTLGIISSALNNGICPGGTVTFTGVPSNYHGYQFFVNGVSVQNGTSATYTTNSVTNNEYVYVVATQPGCPPPPSDTITMTIVAGPTVTATGFSTCYPGANINLSGNGSPQGGFWTGNGIVDSSGIFSPDSVGISTGTLTYTFIDTTGCSGTTSISDTVNGSSISGILPVLQVCHDSATLSVSGGQTYTWSPSTGLSCDNCSSPVFSPSETTTYFVTITDGNGCTIQDSTVVKVNNLNTTPLFTDTTTAAGTPITLVVDTSGTSGQVTYTWVPGDSLSNSHIPSPIATPTVTTTYTLFDTSGGCTDSFSITVMVNSADTFVMPTAFTPNGDGHDDYLYPIFNVTTGTGGAVVKTFRIYNRYGQLVYNNTTSPGWDGRFKGAEEPVGTYIYYVAIQMPESQSEKKMEGSVTLLR